MGGGRKVRRDGGQLGMEFVLLPGLIFLLHAVKTINEVCFLWFTKLPTTQYFNSVLLKNKNALLAQRVS